MAGCAVVTMTSKFLLWRGRRVWWSRRKAQVTGQQDQKTVSQSGKRPAPKRAAEYVRMSTDHQKYSTENQAKAIRQYAETYNMEIVRTYADEGKSGLRIEGRDALQQLIDDVEKGHADFEVILVYDVEKQVANG